MYVERAAVSTWLWIGWAWIGLRALIVICCDAARGQRLLGASWDWTRQLAVLTAEDFREKLLRRLSFGIMNDGFG